MIKQLRQFMIIILIAFIAFSVSPSFAVEFNEKDDTLTEIEKSIDNIDCDTDYLFIIGKYAYTSVLKPSDITLATSSLELAEEERENDQIAIYCLRRTYNDNFEPTGWVIEDNLVGTDKLNPNKVDIQYVDNENVEEIEKKQNNVENVQISDIQNNGQEIEIELTENENKEENGHVHSFPENWTVEVEPTCISVGIEVRQCECGAKQTKKIKDPYAHKKEKVADIAPTCTMYGRTDRSICTLCKQEFFNITKALGHSYSSEYTVDSVATCTEDGVSSKHCLRAGCNESTDKIITKAEGHNYTITETKAATCTTPEVIIKTCSKCGDVKEEYTANKALGHDFENYKQNDDGSCTETGTCTRCGKTDTRLLPAHVHSFPEGWKTVIEPTCLSAGLAERECECGEKETKTIYDPYAHHKVALPDIPATPTTYGKTQRSKCSLCGQEFFNILKYEG